MHRPKARLQIGKGFFYRKEGAETAKDFFCRAACELVSTVIILQLAKTRFRSVSVLFIQKREVVHSCIPLPHPTQAEEQHVNNNNSSSSSLAKRNLENAGEGERGVEEVANRTLHTIIKPQY